MCRVIDRINLSLIGDMTDTDRSGGVCYDTRASDMPQMHTCKTSCTQTVKKEVAKLASGMQIVSFNQFYAVFQLLKISVALAGALFEQLDL